MSESLQLLNEYTRRKMDGVLMFRPLPHQEAVFTCDKSELLLRGGNRSGKTVCSAIRFAAIARELPITLKNGQQIDMRAPHQRARPLLMWVVGYDLKHIGQTIYRVLCKAGLYKIIKDQVTREWRAFDPSIDAGRELEAKPSMPLIPPSEVSDITWEHRGERQFSTITLKNGTMICAFSSIGEVKAGDPVDEIWIDEAIKTPSHYGEWQARLSDKRGRIIWSSWPKRSNQALRDLSRRAKAARENPNSFDSIAEIIIKFSDNPFIDEVEKQKRLAGWSEEDRIARDQGEYALDSLKMYGAFSKEIHCAYNDVPESDDELAKVLRRTNGIPPADWTRTLVLDPGTTHPAILLAAVPPPDPYGDYVVIYDEIYPGRINGADELAKITYSRTKGEVFESFVIDGHAARQTPMGMNVTVGQNYSRAFRRFDLTCRSSGSHFVPGSDDVLARIACVQGWMSTNNTSGWPRLRIVIHRCPILCKQLENYEKTEQDGFILDKPAPRQEIDLAQCYDSETEVLTESGWMRFDGLDGTQSLATVDLATDNIEYQIPTRIIKKPYNGDVFRFGGHKLDAVVTTNHRMVVYPHREDETPVIREAQDLKAWDRIKLHATWNGKTPDVVLVPRVFNGNGGEKECNPGDFAEFLGWYVAEGCCQKYTKGSGRGYAVHVSQLNPLKKPLLRALLDRLPWKFCETPFGFVCSSKQLWHYLKPIGDRCYTKRVPAWVKSASTETIRRFLVGAVLGDGWNRGSRDNYSTSNKLLADDIQELFIKLGTTASVIRRPPTPWNIRGRQGMSREIFIVSQWIRPRAGLRNHAFEPNYVAEKYDGMVYCASVPNTTLIVRRNGKPMVSGNCLEYLAAREPRYVARHESESSHKRSSTYRAYEKLKARINANRSETVHCGPDAARLAAP